ncbi:TPA: relaxase domain-containing protein [Stenotrophomonas maltophilia]|nr:relaxase domain-containing protein [Stenotrophomonas maltophilia]
MFNIEALTQNRSGVADVIAYFKGDEHQIDVVNYYKDEKSATSRWGGKGAEALGLIGKDVDETTMTKLAQGFSPTGEALCQNAGEKPKIKIKKKRDGTPKLDKNGKVMETLEGGHRIGFDATFSVPKDVSVAFAMADKKAKADIKWAIEDANDFAMKQLELEVETRRGRQGIDVIKVEGLVYSSHFHLTNRELECQAHIHNLIYGVAKGEDGQWGAFDADALFQHARRLDEMAKARVYENMKSLGYKLERFNKRDDAGVETGEVITRIAGVDPDLIDQASTRRKDLLAYAKEHGVSTLTACLATRKRKDEPEAEELFELWREWLDNQEGDFARTTKELMAIEQQELLPAKSVDAILQNLHKNDAVFRRIDVLKEVYQEHCGLLTTAEIAVKVDEFLANPDLLEVNAKKLAQEDRGATLSRKYTESRYAAKGVADKEIEVMRNALERAEETHHEISSGVIARSIENFEARSGFSISRQQRRVVNYMSKNQGLILVEGLAGTGKSTISNIMTEIFREEGKVMHGIAVSNDAARVLSKESGMTCSSVAQMLADHDRGKISFGINDVIVLDESGMIATDEVLQVMRIAQKSGSRLIMQGDTDQLQPVRFGSGMQLVRDILGAVKLTEIRRQKKAEDLDIAKSFYEGDGLKRLDIGVRSFRETLQKGKEILEKLEQRGSIDEYEKKEQAVTSLVDDYMSNPDANAEKMILAHSRSEVRMLNKEVRERLKEQGVIGAKGRVIKTMQNGMLEDREFCKGDRIRFNIKNKKLGVINGTEAVIEKMSESRTDGSLNFTVRTTDGARFNFNEKYFNQFDHAYAKTVHKAQGSGAKNIYHLANTGMMDNSSSLVAFTRLTSGDYKLYITSPELEKLHTRLAQERLKENVFETGLRSEGDGRKDALDRLREIANRIRKEREAREEVERLADQSIQVVQAPSRHNSGPSFTR